MRAKRIRINASIMLSKNIFARGHIYSTMLIKSVMRDIHTNIGIAISACALISYSTVYIIFMHNIIFTACFILWHSVHRFASIRFLKPKCAKTDREPSLSCPLYLTLNPCIDSWVCSAFKRLLRFKLNYYRCYDSDANHNAILFNLLS